MSGITQPFKFFIDQTIRHRKGGVYTVKILPDKGRLESTGEPAYSYEAEDGTLWHRSQVEMEDGRFEPHLTATEAIAQ